MGSLSAMARGSAERYFQEDNGLSLSKLVPEGIEGMVPYKGSVHQMLPQLTGGLASRHGPRRLRHASRAAHQGALRAHLPRRPAREPRPRRGDHQGSPELPYGVRPAPDASCGSSIPVAQIERGFSAHCSRFIYTVNRK